MRRIRRTSVMLSIVFFLFCGLLIWIGPPRYLPAASAQLPREEQQEEMTAAKEAQQMRIPPALPPTGGPYLDAESIRMSGLRQARGRGAKNPQVESVRFMTYGEAVGWYGTGWSARIDPYREVYVVSVPGRITVGHHVRLSYERSFYIYDASTGKLVQWGATDLPDPVTEGRPPRR